MTKMDLFQFLWKKIKEFPLLRSASLKDPNPNLIYTIIKNQSTFVIFGILEKIASDTTTACLRAVDDVHNNIRKQHPR